ncbi:MAG TPA: hypothetical protein V6C91_21465 [Coleofasciculaceae cyanobacterium]
MQEYRTWSNEIVLPIDKVTGLLVDRARKCYQLKMRYSNALGK